VPHKEKRLHPTKAFARMRQVSVRGAREGWREKKRREKGGRILPQRRGKVPFSPIFPAFTATLSSTFRVPSSFLSSRKRTSFPRRVICFRDH